MQKEEKLTYLLRLEGQADTVDAISLMSRSRSIIEYVAKVSIATLATHLNALHAMGVVGQVRDGVTTGSGGESGPSTATLELFLGGEEKLATTNAEIITSCVSLAVLTSEGCLRVTQSGDTILLCCEHLAPFFIRLNDLFRVCTHCSDWNRPKCARDSGGKIGGNLSIIADNYMLIEF